MSRELALPARADSRESPSGYRVRRAAADAGPGKDDPTRTRGHARYEPRTVGSDTQPSQGGGTARLAVGTESRLGGFGQQHGHDLEPLLDACSRMEPRSRRGGLFSTPSRAAWQAEQGPATAVSVATTQGKAPVC